MRQMLTYRGGGILFSLISEWGDVLFSFNLFPPSTEGDLLFYKDSTYESLLFFLITLGVKALPSCILN